MLIQGMDGCLPLQNSSIRPAAPLAGARRGRPGSYDNISLSAPAEVERRSFQDAVASLSYQVRTANTTGKIQELRRQVGSGEYQISPREVAARMLLMEEGE